MKQAAGGGHQLAGVRLGMRLLDVGRAESQGEAGRREVEGCRRDPADRAGGRRPTPRRRERHQPDVSTGVLRERPLPPRLRRARAGEGTDERVELGQLQHLQHPGRSGDDLQAAARGFQFAIGGAQRTYAGGTDERHLGQVEPHDMLAGAEEPVDLLRERRAPLGVEPLRDADDRARRAGGGAGWWLHRAMPRAVGWAIDGQRRDLSERVRRRAMLSQSPRRAGGSERGGRHSPSV